MKKILHLTISSETGGGPEHICQLVKGLDSEFESHIACPYNGSYFEKFVNITSNRVVELPHRKFSVYKLLGVYKYIKNNNIDLIHGHGKGAGIYCRIINLFLRIPSIHTPHGINKKIEIGFINKLYIHFERIFGFLISSVIYVSKTEFEYSKEINLWSKVPYEIINNGTSIIDQKDIEHWRNEIRTKYNWINKQIVITASRFDYQKNTLEFCKIAAELSNSIFVILGDGEEKKECVSFCDNFKINNVLFLGNVSNPLPYFAASDVYLSTARWEGLSMAILESMSVGLPIIATKVTGNIDLVNHSESGFLYNLGEIKVAVNYLQFFILNNDYKNFSVKSKTLHSQFFSSNSMCKKTSLLYASILSKQSK